MFQYLMQSNSEQYKGEFRKILRGRNLYPHPKYLHMLFNCAKRKFTKGNTCNIKYGYFDLLLLI